MIPIDPFAALEAVQTAVSLVKKAAATVDDVTSLGPVLGKYFDAKVDALQVIQTAKSGGFKGSSMGKALELEMALEQAREFEEQVKGLFFSSNKMDVWQRIKARAAKMEAEAAVAAKKEKEAAARKKKERDEIIEAIVLGVLTLILFGMLIYGTIYFLVHCNSKGCY
jgi:hypothetical protein